MRAVHRLLTIAGALLLLTGTVAGVVNREVLDAHRFAAHVDAVRADPAVSRAVGAVVTERILEAQPDLTAIRPLLEATATSVVASPMLGSAARAAGVGPVYRGLTRGGQNAVVLRLADVAAIALGVVAVAAPEQRGAPGRARRTPVPVRRPRHTGGAGDLGPRGGAARVAAAPARAAGAGRSGIHRRC